MVVEIKGPISDIRSTRGLFTILSLIRKIGNEEEGQIFEQDTTEFPVICDNDNETLISATAGNFRVEPIRLTEFYRIN